MSHSPGHMIAQLEQQSGHRDAGARLLLGGRAKSSSSSSSTSSRCQPALHHTAVAGQSARKDPGEASARGLVKKMQAAYEKFWTEARPLMVNEGVPMSKTRPFHVWHAEQLKNDGIPDWSEPEL